MRYPQISRVTTVLLKNLPYLLSSGFGVVGGVDFVDFVDFVAEFVDFIVEDSSSLVVKAADVVVVAGIADVEVSSGGLLTIFDLPVDLFHTNTIESL